MHFCNRLNSVRIEHIVFYFSSGSWNITYHYEIFLNRSSALFNFLSQKIVRYTTFRASFMLELLEFHAKIIATAWLRPTVCKNVWQLLLQILVLPRDSLPLQNCTNNVGPWISSLNLPRLARKFLKLKARRQSQKNILTRAGVVSFSKLEFQLESAFLQKKVTE